MFRNRSFLKNSRRFYSVAALGLSALLLVSCGGDDEDEPTEEVLPPTVEEVEEVTEAAAASPAAASPMASPVVASPVTDAATPVSGAATPASFVVASPVMSAASPVASPVASPMATGPVDVSETSELGEFLTDSDGMTLYIFTNDEVDSGTSVCNDDCAENWPPFNTDDDTLPADVDGELTVVTRDDGSEQLAFNGMPLYYFAADAAPGDTNGHEAGDVWFVAAVGAEGTPVASPEASPAS